MLKKLGAALALFVVSLLAGATGWDSASVEVAATTFGNSFTQMYQFTYRAGLNTNTLYILDGQVPQAAGNLVDYTALSNVTLRDSSGVDRCAKTTSMAAQSLVSFNGANSYLPKEFVFTCGTTLVDGARYTVTGTGVAWRSVPISTGAQFVASASGTTLTVTSMNGGINLAVGMSITSGTGMFVNNTCTTITAFGTGHGGTGTYTLSQAVTASSEPMAANTSSCIGTSPSTTRYWLAF